MKLKYLITPLLVLSTYVVSAQTIRNAYFTIDERNKTVTAALNLSNGISVTITEDGEVFYERGKVPVRYYSDFEDSSKVGKIKSIGDMEIKYNDQFDIHSPTGRVKSIGNIKVQYFDTFDIHYEKNRLKSIGDIKLDYYNAFDIHDPNGKIKSIGNVKIQYYNVFDGAERKGLIKSIKGNSRNLYVRVYTH